MAETKIPPKENGQMKAPSVEAAPNGKPAQKRGPSIHQIYALPAPLRTFPLPAFYPNNPISLFHIAYAWLRQTLAPPPAEPSVIHNGFWSEATTSVHITDEKSMRALWEQGFYGKGNLSRSEPNWLSREQVRRGLQETHVSEILTQERREERARAKWERARLEQEAIRKTRLEEAKQAEVTLATLASLLPPEPLLKAPVGPQELLALPNSDIELSRISKSNANGDDTVFGIRASTGAISAQLPADIVPVASMVVANGSALQEDSDHVDQAGLEDVGNAIPSLRKLIVNGGGSHPAPSDTSSDSNDDKSLRRQKSVRFSPKVESATFNFADPPSPNHSASESVGQKSLANGSNVNHSKPSTGESSVVNRETEDIVNMEHLQLTPEEAFFLAFAFGALTITDPASGQKLGAKELLTLFRQYSTFPPRIGAVEADLGPDDGFLLHYAVYHHFRSLGWVPRPGIKFGVDWLLYVRGPVFDHAEFGLIVLPSYSDPWWKARGKHAPNKTWAWLHSVVRVLSHVTKSLVLVYVDVPPPPKFDAALETGFADALKLYKVREVMVKRWSSNRNR